MRQQRNRSRPNQFDESSGSSSGDGKIDLMAELMNNPKKGRAATNRNKQEVSNIAPTNANRQKKAVTNGKKTAAAANVKEDPLVQSMLK